MSDLKVGDRLSPMIWPVTQEKINRYSRYALGRDSANIHTDTEKARLAGLPGPVAHGRHPVALVSEAMMRDFGAAWARGGELDMTLTRLIFPGDTLTLEREVVSVSREGDGSVVTVSIAFVNQDGQPVQTGEARVRLEGRRGETR
ncbi:MAG TPA: MaoC family dehydratase [Methylomirabilota bacterium]|jgi:acyl dehydratase